MSKLRIDRFEVINNSQLITSIKSHKPVTFSEDENYNLKIELSGLTKKQYIDILKKIETICDEEVKL